MRIEIGRMELEFRNPDRMLGQLAKEWEAYDFDSIPWEEGDVVIDVGAHRGGVSITLAKTYGVRCLAFEPHPENYSELEAAVALNGVRNLVRTYRLAVTKDGRRLRLYNGSHSGEHGAWHQGNLGYHFVASTTIRRVMGWYRLKRARLLKLDCEGAEHEILAGDPGLVSRFDHIRGEVHLNARLERLGYSFEETMARAPYAKWMTVG